MVGWGVCGGPRRDRGMSVQHRGVAVVGFGPAGVGVLTGALREGVLDRLVRAGVVVLEDQNPASAPSGLSAYAIDSDSLADSFLAPLGSWGPDDRFRSAGPWADSVLAALSAHGPLPRGQAVPLSWAAKVQELLREMVLREADRVRADHGGTGVELRTGERVVSVQRLARGWRVRTQPVGIDDAMDPDGATWDADSVVLACGAIQHPDQLRAVRVAGLSPGRDLLGTVLGSDAVLRHGGTRRILDAVAGHPAPRAAIVGGGHSAMAVARVLLGLADTHAVPWEPGAITILHRRPLRATFPSPEAAREAGYDEFVAEDVCPRTGRVFPLAGFRAGSRELYLAIRGLGGRPAESRVSLIDLRRTPDDEVGHVLHSADVVVLATGYTRLVPPILDERGGPIALHGTDHPLHHVDARSRVLAAGQRPLDGLFATGLAAGYPMAGTYGEPSFVGLANGTSLWQTDIGGSIARQTIRRHEESVADRLADRLADVPTC